MEILTIIVFVLFVLFVGTKIFQWLWNITIPELFGLKEIRYWQAFRLIIICKILFAATTMATPY